MPVMMTSGLDHVHLVDEQILGGIADRKRQCR